MCRADLAIDPDVGLLVFGACVRCFYSRLGEFLHGVVVHRRDESIRSWRNWILEDPLVHPYRWLQPDLVPPSPFVSCDPGITPGGSGVLSDPALIDEQFRNAWLPYLSRADRGVADPSGFDAEVGGWLPSLSEVEFPPLVERDLVDIVHKKKPTAGSLDGWGWREFKGLPLAWF